MHDGFTRNKCMINQRVYITNKYKNQTRLRISCMREKAGVLDKTFKLTRYQGIKSPRASISKLLKRTAKPEFGLDFWLLKPIFN